MSSPTLEPIVNQPNLYINGLLISNDATTANTVLDVAAGICRDSTNSYDINLGNYLGLVDPTGTALALNSVTDVNFGVNGVNGLDTGSIAASTVYCIYAIMDPTGYHPTACIASTALPSVGPQMPFGYGAYRLIGYWATDSSSHLLKGYQANANGNWRKFFYDAPQATSITTGNATSYTAIDLSALVPNVNNTPVYVQSNFNANAAADTLKLQPVNGTGDAVIVVAQVAGSSAHIQTVSTVLAQISSSKPEINYKVSSSSDAVAIDVAGFEFAL